MTDSHAPESRAPRPSASSTAVASADAFLSSGQSPGALSTLHLVGPGQVGRAFLGKLDRRRVRLVAVSDSSATVFDRGGLPGGELARCKATGGQLLDWPRAESIPTELAIRLARADIVVDITPSTMARASEAVQCGRAALQNGAFLVLCNKNALSLVAPEWLAPAYRQRVGIDAVLGGTGRQLLAELDELQADCSGLALVGNVTTTAIVSAVERGASLDEGIAVAQAAGFLEPDPTSDLDGTDAAAKLLLVWAALFGETFLQPPTLAAVQKEDLRELDSALLRERAARGATTRLVARGSRKGGDLRVTFEELAIGSPLAAPADRVVYGYQLPHGLRVHTGAGVGYQRTADALWGDVDACLSEVSR